MALDSATDQNFNSLIKAQTGLVLVDFWAEWCGPCRAITPILEEIDATMADMVKILKVNIDENPETPTNYNIRSIPTLILFKNGEPIATQIGLVSKDALKEWIKTNA
jgi:thioredoxin 1